MRISVISPSRIHLSLIDLNGSIGRIDGGIGFGISYPETRVEVSIETDSQNPIIIEANEEHKPLIKFVISALEESYNISFDRLKVTIKSFCKPHIGLGSKTQLLLSLAKALSLLKNLDVSTYDLCKIVKRGGTSGIGYSVFDKGGFILDGGHSFGEKKDKTSFLPSSASDAPPALFLAKYDVPTSWKIILMTLNVESCAFDKTEVNAFQKGCPIPLDQVKDISHNILMRVIPSLLTNNLSEFGDGINSIQRLGFKNVEMSLAHPEVLKLIEYAIGIGAKCAALSSFGPTVAIIEDEPEKINGIVKKIQKQFEEFAPEIIITEANNTGARIEKN